MPALDGVRAVAVLAVVLFHARVPGVGWGFLGVDVFFVLSGYLITAGLLREADTGRVDLGRFWSNRVRRLLPAAALLLLTVLVWGLTFMPAYQREDLGADLWWTALYLGNWHFMTTSSYFDHTYLPSPLQHMWSLGVEEQFYLVWPVLVALVVAVVRRRRHLAVLVLASALAAVSVVLLAWQLRHGGAERAYMGSDTKAFEPLVGAAFAALTPVARVRERSAAASTVLTWAALLCAALLVPLLTTATGAGRGYYDLGAAAFSVLVAVVVSGLVEAPVPALARVLSWTPVAYLGRISYGVYLWHWPVVVWVMGADAWSPTSTLVVLALTVAAASASYHLVERPVRRRRVGRAAPIGVAAAAACVLALAAAPLGGTPASPLANRVAPLPGSTGERVILVVGDSVPKRLLPYLSQAAWERGYTLVSGAAGGCSPLGYETVVAPGNTVGRRCRAEVRARIADRMAAHHPGAVLWWSRYETADRRVGGRMLTPSDPVFWTDGERDLRQMSSELTAAGARLTVVETDRPGIGIRAQCAVSCAPFVHRMADDDALRVRWNGVLRHVAATTPRVATTSVDGLYCHDAASPCDDTGPGGRPVRADGSHFSDPAMARHVAQVLVARVLDGVRA